MYNALMDRRETPDNPIAQPLTRREQDVLNCIGGGKTNRQIAEQLTFATSTVKWYVRQIYNKLGVKNRQEAIVRAKSLGLLTEEELEDTVRHNLPVAITPFVGRERELASLAELFADPQVRFITIVGPGGIGKTRLALEAAGCELHPGSRFPDGIFFISLAAVDSAGGITGTLATALDFHFQGAGQGSRSETVQLLDYLRRKQMLLVLDNFEQILDGRTLVAEINEQAADIKLMVTSRERLQLQGEQLFPLHGLDIPETADSVEESIDDYAAAQLFLNIAKRTVPDFQLLEGDREQLLRICRLVEGMPLGLELAASWVGLLQLSDVADEIEQGLQLFTTEHQDVPERHRSMQATLDVSWRRLNAEQQISLQKLTVFRGGFRRSTALEIAGATLPLLVILVNKSWLSYDRQCDRYHIHELLRQYAAAKLSADPVQERALREWHSAYFCRYLQDREADWFGPRQQKVAAEVRDEMDNIQRAWRWAANKGDGVLLTQGLNCLCRFYLWEGRMKDGQNTCRLAGDGLSKSLGEQGADDPQDLTLWSQVLAWQSEFIDEVTQKEELLTQSQQLLDQASRTGWDTRAEQAFIYLEKAYAAKNKDYEVAIQMGTLGLEIFREVGNRWCEAEILRVLGVNYLFLGSFQRAHELLHESLKIRQQLEDTQGIAITTTNLGLVAQHQGEYEEAETLHRQGLRQYRLLDNRFNESMGLTVLSFTHSWAGKFSAARETAKLALELERDLGKVPDLWSLTAFTTATIHLGCYIETTAKAAEGLEIAGQRGHLTEKGFALMHLGNIAFVQGDLTNARTYLSESAALLAELRYVYQALPRANLCLVVRIQGEGKLARDYLGGALRSGIEFHSTTPIMYCLPAAALLAADDGHTERAIELYSLAQQFGHITNSRWFEDVACRELDEVRASLPPEVASAAEARGRELDLWSTVDQIGLELAS